MRKHNGYYNVKSVTPGTAKIVVRGTGLNTVVFATSTESNACESFKKLAVVKDVGRGYVYPWIADMVPGTEFASSDITPGQLIVVRGDTSSSGFISTPNSSSINPGSCGPLYSKFIPLENHAYIIEFQSAGKKCSQQILDATDPDAPVPVATAPFLSCAKR